MKVVFTYDSGRVSHYLDNIEEIFSMLVKKKGKLTIKCENGEFSTRSYGGVAKHFEIGYREKKLHIIFYKCYDIAGQVYIENCTDVTVSFIAYCGNKYITEFPVLDNTVTHLQINIYVYSIGEECEYFNNLPPTLVSLIGHILK